MLSWLWPVQDPITKYELQYWEANSENNKVGMLCQVSLSLSLSPALSLSLSFSSLLFLCFLPFNLRTSLNFQG